MDFFSCVVVVLFWFGLVFLVTWDCELMSFGVLFSGILYSLGSALEWGWVWESGIYWQRIFYVKYQAVGS